MKYYYTSLKHEGAETELLRSWFEELSSSGFGVVPDGEQRGVSAALIKTQRKVCIPDGTLYPMQLGVVARTHSVNG